MPTADGSPRVRQRNGFDLAGETDVKTQAALTAALNDASAVAPCLLYIHNFGALRNPGDNQEQKGASAGWRIVRQSDEPF